MKPLWRGRSAVQKGHVPFQLSCDLLEAPGRFDYEEEARATGTDCLVLNLDVLGWCG